MRRADFMAPAIAGIIFAAFVALYHWARPAYDFLLTWWGIRPFRTPFLDTGAIVSAIECVRRGVDVYVTDPCDVLGRPHVYSPLWLAASVWPITRAWTRPVGLVLDIAFLLSLAALPMPAERRGRWMLVAATLSTMSVYAVERANSDIVIFLLLLCAGLASAQSSDRSGQAVWRRCAYPLILFAAFLKFYPAAGLILSFRERRAAFLTINILSLFAVLIFAATEWNGLVHVLTNIPTGSYYTDWFGARNLPFGVAALLYTPSRAPMVRLLPPVLLAILVAHTLWLATMLARRPVMSAALGKLPEREKVLLVIGAAMVTGCFFAGQNIGYRGIYFLMVLPGLLALAQRTAGDRCGEICANAAKLIALVMWSEALRHAIIAAHPLDHPALYIFEVAFWVGRELIWWRIVAVLCGILLRFVLSSPLWHKARSEQTAAVAAS
jgi:hypothetical protein